MDDTALRLECLRLAAARQGATDPRDLKVIAADLYGWVTGQASTEAPAAPATEEAGKPTGRKAGGSAARQ